MDDLRPSASSPSSRTPFFLWLIPLLFFSPVLIAGLYWDDLLLAIEHYYNKDSFSSIYELILDRTKGWIEGRGRFFPISTIFSITLLCLFDFNNHLGYHIIQLVAISLSLILFTKWFSSSMAKDRLACLLLLCLCASFYPHYHDPYLSYHIVLPIFCMMLFSAIHLFDCYLQKQKTGYVIGALAFYLLAISTYEIAYPLIFIFAIQLYTAKGKKLPVWIGLASLFVILVAFQLWLRSQAETMGYKGTDMALEPIKVIRTFTIQAFSPFPFALPIGNGIRWLGDNNKGIPIESLLAGGAFLLFLAFALYILWRYWRNQTRENALLLIGVIIWLAPAALIAITVKYQGELRWGTGYIPRFLQIFGVVLLFLGLLRPYLTSKTGLAVLTVSACLIFSLNIRTVRDINRDFTGARLFLNIIEDKEFLESINCKRLHVNDLFVREAERILPLNSELEIIEGQTPNEGDHVLFVHPDHAGSEWAILGQFQNGALESAKVFTHSHQRAKENSNGIIYKEWIITAYPELPLKYEQAWEILNSGKLPLNKK